MGPHVCPWWLAYTFDNPLRTLFHNPEKIYAPYVREGMTVADIGCGMGYFSIGLAKIVREKGKVIAADIQIKMLKKTEKRARRAAVSEIIECRLCKGSALNITEPLDFALAFWMVHETQDAEKFFKEVFAVLKPSGLLLVAEPKFHVSARHFKKETDAAKTIGFMVKDEPRIAFSHAAVFEKPSSSLP